MGILDRLFNKKDKNIRKADIHKQRGHTILGGMFGALTKEDFEKAEPEFREALKYNPDDANARFFLALCLGHKGKIDEIIRLLEEIIQLDPDDGAHSHLARIYDSQGRYAEAAHEYKEALRVYKEGHDPEFGRFELAANMTTNVMLGKPTDSVADWPDIKTRLAEIQNESNEKS